MGDSVPLVITTDWYCRGRGGLGEVGRGGWIDRRGQRCRLCWLQLRVQTRHTPTPNPRADIPRHAGLLLIVVAAPAMARPPSLSPLRTRAAWPARHPGSSAGSPGPAPGQDRSSGWWTGWPKRPGAAHCATACLISGLQCVCWHQAACHASPRSLSTRHGLPPCCARPHTEGSPRAGGRQRAR